MRSRSPPCGDPGLIAGNLIERSKTAGVIWRLAVVTLPGCANHVGPLRVYTTCNKLSYSSALLHEGPEEKAEGKPKPRRNPTANFK
jgi:hypothetical protein